MAKISSFRQWSQYVAERANYKCERCGIEVSKSEGRAHHKIPKWFMPELKFDADNGIFLCHECHRAIHCGQGGIKDDEFTSTILKTAIRIMNERDQIGGQS